MSFFFIEKRDIPGTINLVDRKQQTFARLWGTRTERDNPNKLGAPLPSRWLSETLSRHGLKFIFQIRRHENIPFFTIVKRVPRQDNDALSDDRNNIDSSSRRIFRQKTISLQRHYLSFSFFCPKLYSLSQYSEKL